MKKIKLAVTGCMGKMGRKIIESAKLDKNFKLISLTENKKINKKINGIKIDLNSEKAFKNVNLIIDFTVPKCTFQVLKIASKLKKRVIIGTTGFTKNEEDLFKAYKNYRLCIVHTEMEEYIFLNYQEYESLIQNKRIQYQINFKSSL